MVFPVLSPGKKLPFPGNGKGNYKMPREEKFEACIPGNHGKREFPLTPGTKHIFSASYEEIFFDKNGNIGQQGENQKKYITGRNLRLICNIL